MYMMLQNIIFMCKEVMRKTRQGCTYVHTLPSDLYLRPWLGRG